MIRPQARLAHAPRDGGNTCVSTILFFHFQAWRQHHKQQGGGESNRGSLQGFSGGEMAALGVVAGQAAAALRRLGVEEAEREGASQKLDAAAADRVDEMQVKGISHSLLLCEMTWFFEVRVLLRGVWWGRGFAVVALFDQRRRTPSKFEIHEEGAVYIASDPHMP